ncbi:MAG: pyruvate kinase [Burkholderiales bacterium]
MRRKTKIVATLGPASSDAKVLDRMIEAGVDVVRLNFSHGSADKHVEIAETVRSLARARGRAVGVLVDLQGPKIRIGKFKRGSVTVKNDSPFVIDHLSTPGDETRVGTEYPDLARDVDRGSTLLLGDGRIMLWVEEVQGDAIRCKVVQGGTLSDNVGVNQLGGGLSAAALTDKDKEDIKTAAAMKADFVAVSFPRNGEDMELARELLRSAGWHPVLIAKIERAEAVPAFDEILRASDAIMVARGDLGVEVGDASVPGLQKRMIRVTRDKIKVVITATQMMESMVHNPIPTRAEVSDVANAVIDGTNAVMLSAETAVGEYPVETVAAVHRICLEAERQMADRDSKSVIADARLNQPFEQIDESIAMATIFTANHLPVRAIASLTQSGKTALWMSRMSSDVPIYALTPVVQTRRKLTLYRGVYPVNFRMATHDPEELLYAAEDELVRRGAVRDGDLMVLTIGEPIGKSGGTNTMKIVCVGARRKP